MNIELTRQDCERIAQVVVEALKEHNGKKVWLTREEAAEHVRCSVRKLDELVRLGEIPCYKPAGRPLFDPVDLDAYIINRRET